MDIVYIHAELCMSSWAHSLQVVYNFDYFANECAKTLHKLYLQKECLQLKLALQHKLCAISSKKKTKREESRLQTQFSSRPEALHFSSSSRHSLDRAHTWRHTLSSQIVPKMWISCLSVFFEENLQPDPELQIHKTVFVRKCLPKCLWIYCKLACLTSQRSQCIVMTRFHHKEDIKWNGEDFGIKAGGSLCNGQGIGRKSWKKSLSRMNSKLSSTVTHTIYIRNNTIIAATRKHWIISKCLKKS